MARRWPLRRYLLGLVVLFVLTAAAGSFYGWRQSARDATGDALRDAAFGARLAASELGTSLGTVRASVAQVAGSPHLPGLYANPRDCSLAFTFTGGPDAGHIDVLDRSGSVVCSSRPVAGGRGSYAGASWLADALTAPEVVAPVTDPRVGGTAVVVTAPVPGLGAIAGFLNLTLLGPTIAELFGGPRNLEFLVTTGDGGSVLTRSVDPKRWAGTSVSNTRFRIAGPVARPDVAGVSRLYGEATVAVLGWRVYAGAGQAQALAAARRLAEREVAIVLTGLLVALAMTFLVYRRITRPIGRLSRAVRAAAGESGGGAVPVDGPTEVAGLAHDFNGVLDAVDRELTQRRQAEETAREMERNYHQLFDGNPYPTFVLDSETTALLEVNDAAVSHYGYSRAELLSRAFTDLCVPEDAPALARAISSASTVDHTGPLRQVTGTGIVIQVNVISHSLSFAGREARCAVIEDVTAREQLERRLRQSERLESLGQLAGGVAHDFNNLLNIILGYAGLAASEVELAAGTNPRWKPVHDDLHQVLEAVERATTLTRQLLSFARAEVVRPRVLNLNDVVTDLEQMLRRALGEDIHLHAHLADDLRAVRMDPGQLEQVLVNLAVNAGDAMPTGGTLAIETANFTVDDHYALQHPGVHSGQYVRLRVSDTGTGMSRDTIERAFEPFFTTKPKGQGTGLGLATIYGIMTNAGGSVQIYSEPGVGTTITALLPATDQSPTPDSTPVVVPRPGNGETILVVEDEDSLRRLTTRLLGHHGYQVISAEDGEEALRLTGAGEPIDLVVTDVVMPGMLGHELVHRLREQRPGLGVVYLSGYAEQILTARKTLPPGVTLLTKPVTETQLLSAVREGLDAASSADLGVLAPRKPV